MTAVLTCPCTTSTALVGADKLLSTGGCWQVTWCERVLAGYLVWESAGRLDGVGECVQVTLSGRVRTDYLLRESASRLDGVGECGQTVRCGSVRARTARFDCIKQFIA